MGLTLMTATSAPMSSLKVMAWSLTTINTDIPLCVASSPNGIEVNHVHIINSLRLTSISYPFAESLHGCCSDLSSCTSWQMASFAGQAPRRRSGCGPLPHPVHFWLRCCCMGNLTCCTCFRSMSSAFPVCFI